MSNWADAKAKIQADDVAAHARVIDARIRDLAEGDCSMNAGREMDALVAEKVMGWTRVVGQNELGEEYTEIRDAQGETMGWAWGEPELAEVDAVPRYSTDIAEAWRALEKLGGTFDLAYLADVSLWQACFSDTDPIGEAMADTAPLAICLAALKAVGAEVPA
jgi:hypothetical protein